MKNFIQILEKFSIEIPDDKQKEISKAIAEQYKPIAEVDNLQSKIENLTTEKESLQAKYKDDIAKRDKDLKELKDKLENAGTDEEQLQSVTKQLDELKETYKTDKANYEKQLQEQKYEFAVKEQAGELKFTSNAAKKAFIADVIAKGLKLGDDGKLLGFDDYVDEYGKEDEGVFVKEETEDPESSQPKEGKPEFTQKRGAEGSDGGDDKGGEAGGAEARPLIW